MKNLLLAAMLFSTLLFTSCKDDDKDTVVNPSTDVSVASFNPVSGAPGTKVVIIGTNFGTEKAALTVKFGAAVAKVDSIISSTSIIVSVPDSAAFGEQQLTVTKASVTTTAKIFTVVNPIVGTWVSEGVNIPYGLKVAPFRVVKIVATFNTNLSYTVVQTDSNNVNTTLTGTYTATGTSFVDVLATSKTIGSKIFNIVANQASPAAVTSTGIFCINGADMTYEIIQTTPPIAGVNPPTPAGGFGSTTIGGTKYAIYIQKYVKQ